MKVIENNKLLVTNFMEAIWNQRDFGLLGNFLHDNFIDHSLPPAFPANADGLKLWVMATGEAFEHKSVIDAQVAEADKSMIKFRIFLKHIGAWRNIEPTGAEISTVGYRYFRIADGRIIEHWALVDGNSIENQLKDKATGCKIQE